jgi:hypothetical protein
LARLAAGLGASVCGLAVATTSFGASLELTVKAIDLYKVAPFVEWPAGALGPATAPLAICIVGHDPFGTTLDHAVAGQQALGRAIVIRRMATASPDAACAVAFLGSGPAAREALKALHDAPILTVTDGAGAEAGVIDFVLDSGRVRFRVDAAQAQARRLKIGSQLLGLAVAVNGVRSERTP